MGMSRNQKMLSIMAVCSAVLLGPIFVATPSLADTEEKAITTRQGFMRLVIWNAGPLFGMATGKVAYDAEAAAGHAANLSALSHYSFPDLFLPDTSQADRPGQTCALPAIWEDTAKLDHAFKDFGTAIAALGEVAGNGQPALAAAVGEMGKACGGCHKPFRDRDPATNKWCLPDS
jgi:cytochrome c556